MRAKHAPEPVENTLGTGSGLLDDSRLHELIASRAYELYENHGRLEGHDCENWLEAETQILAEVETKAVSPQAAVTQHAA